MHLPDYDGGSIVNLMSSIATHFGGTPAYKPLIALPPGQLAGAGKVVLVVIDGLGYQFLQQHGQGSTLLAHLKGKMTSVFPSTTAAAISSFYTGLAPLNHGIPAWFTLLREVGLVAAILRTAVRATKQVFVGKDFPPDAVFNAPSLFSTMTASSVVVMPKKLRDSAYNQALGGPARRLGYKNLKGFFAKMLQLLRKASGPTYVMGYWDGFDKLAHVKGIGSAETATHFQEIDAQVKVFLDRVTEIDPSTKVIITADHGLVDCPPEKVIPLRDHKSLEDALSLPLCGEARTAFCYVRPSKVPEFESYVQTKLQYACDMVKFEDLVKGNYFGLNAPHPKIFARVGDYVLLMKENYILWDELVGENREKLIGHHGGLSEAEMFVPLIIH